MNKKVIIGFIIGIGVLAILAIASSGSSNSSETVAGIGNVQKNNVSSIQGTQSFPVAEKVEVVHFHAAQQCWSCITVGEYALKTIKEKFPEEYASGKIVFMDVNGELPENRNLVEKFRASGSSLFVNAITNGNDKIEEDVMVWRLITNEQQFINYFEDKLKKLIGKL